MRKRDNLPKDTSDQISDYFIDDRGLKSAKETEAELAKVSPELWAELEKEMEEVFKKYFG